MLPQSNVSAACNPKSIGILLRRAGLLASVLCSSVGLIGCNSAHSPTGPARQAGSAIFREVAKSAGLDFRWGHGGKTPLNIIETIGHGSAFLDYDQDGLLDVLLAGTPRCALYHNT